MNINGVSGEVFNNRSRCADDPLVGSATVVVRLGESDRQVDVQVPLAWLRRSEEGGILVLFPSEHSRRVGVFYLHGIRKLSQRVGISRDIRHPEFVPGVGLVCRARVVECSAAAIVVNLNGVVGRFAKEIGRFVVIVCPPGSRSEQRYGSVKVVGSKPVGVAGVSVEIQGRTVNESRAGRHISCCRHVHVHQAWLVSEVERVIQLLVYETVVEGTIQGHIVHMKHGRPVRIDNSSQQHVVLRDLSYSVRGQPKLFGWLCTTVLGGDG